MYIIIEIQKSNSGTATIVPPVTHTDRNTAEAAYHTALAAAATSSVAVHSVVMLSDVGEKIMGQTYYHGQSPVD